MLNRRLLRVKVLQILYGFYCGGEASLPDSLKALRRSLERYYDLMHLIALLPEALVKKAEAHIALGRKKYLPTPEDLNPNLRFVQNQAIAALAANGPLHDYAADRGLSWGAFPDELQIIYEAMLSQPFYLDYMAETETSWVGEKVVLVGLFDWLSELGSLEEFLETVHIHWTTDFPLVMDAVKRMVGEMVEGGSNDCEILPTRVDTIGKEFAEHLMSQTVLHYNENHARVGEALVRWDAERVAQMDLLILVMALSEVQGCPDIPRRVTMNEYIELARIFSTEASPAFVNGVLDRLVAQLMSEGLIRKAGRGLQGD